MSDTPLFSRIHTHPLGKCTEEIKTSVPEEAKEALIALAFARGVTPAEFHRSVILNYLYGSANMLRLHHRQHDSGTAD